MMVAIIRHYRSTSVVLVDTYSSLGFYYALGAAMVCRLLSIPYIPILRGGNLKIRLRNNPFLSRFVFGGAKILIAPSGYLLNTFQEFGFKNIEYIPNSIELGIYTMAKKEIIAPKLLWVRSFHSIYNPRMAVEVLKEIADQFPQATLCMVGPDRDGTLKQCQEIVQRYGLSDRVKFTGVLLKAEWINLSRDFNVFINTTTIDNTPVSVIEAMALGLPVVSTNVGGIPYLIADNENGLLVQSEDVDGMVEKIIRLINNPSEVDRIRMKARTLVETFDWESIKFKWFTLLDAFEKEAG